MKTRSRRPVQDSTYLYDEEADLDLDHLSDAELEALLFEEEEQPKSGVWNLPTMTGLAMILVGIVYIIQSLNANLLGFLPNLSQLVAMLPWLGAIMIILLGFGVLSWSPSRKKKLEAKLKAAALKAQTQAHTQAQTVTAHKEKVNKKIKEMGEKKKLRKSSNKKISGVAAGLAEYFNVDPTLIRIAFVACLPFFWFFTPLTYILLGFVMPDPEKKPFVPPDRSSSKKSSSSSSGEKRIRIRPD